MSVDYTIKPDGGAISASFGGAGVLRRARASVGSLYPGSTKFYDVCWVRLDTLTPANVYGMIVGLGFLECWQLYYFKTTQRVVATFVDSASTRWDLTATALGVPTPGVWYFAEIWRDGDQLGIRITPSTSSSRSLSINTTTISTNAANVGTLDFAIGASLLDPTTPVGKLEGDVDEAYHWFGTFPSEGELDQVFNAGDGISRGEFEDLELTTPYAAWGMEETSGTRFDWVGDKHLSVYGTVGSGVGHIVTADYTLLQTWAADLASSYDGSTAWNALVYAGGDFLGSANYALSGIQEAGSEPVTIRAADGQRHGGDPASGAFTASDLTIENCDRVHIDGLRFEGSDLSYIGGGSNTDFRATSNLFDAGLLYILLEGVDLDGLLLENNLAIENPAFGILIYLDASADDVLLDNAQIIHNTILGIDSGDYGIEVIGAESAGEVTAAVDLLNNVAMDAATCIYVTGITNLILDQRGNATSDSTGEITGLAAADVFADPGSDDFDTKADGPTYRAGVASPTTIDILLRSRSGSGSTPDIGAFQIALVVTSEGGSLASGDGYSPNCLGSCPGFC